MGVSLKLLFKQLRRKRDTKFYRYCKCYRAISVMGNEKCHVYLFNDGTASIYLNSQCKHKLVRPFHMF